MICIWSCTYPLWSVPLSHFTISSITNFGIRKKSESGIAQKVYCARFCFLFMSPYLYCSCFFFRGREAGTERKRKGQIESSLCCFWITWRRKESIRHSKLDLWFFTQIYSIGCVVFFSGFPCSSFSNYKRTTAEQERISCHQLSQSVTAFSSFSSFSSSTSVIIIHHYPVLVPLLSSLLPLLSLFRFFPYLSDSLRSSLFLVDLISSPAKKLSARPYILLPSMSAGTKLEDQERD